MALGGRVGGVAGADGFVCRCYCVWHAVCSVILFVYAWAYFALLRHVTENLLLWLIILFLGSLAPISVSFMGVA